MDEWTNESLSFVVRIAAACLLACWCFVIAKVQFCIHNTTFMYMKLCSITQHAAGRKGVSRVRMEKSLTLKPIFICMCDTHTHTHARRQKRKWMSSNDCVGKSFSTQKLFAHLNYKLDYESCDWISDVIVIMYSFRKMCVNTHAHARFCHGYDLCVNCDMDTKFHTLFHFLSLTFDFAHTHTCQKIIVLVNLSEKCYVLLVFCSVLFNSFLTIISLLCFFYCLSLSVCVLCVEM